MFIPFLENCLVGGWWCVCGQVWTPAVLQNKCFKLLYFVFCIPLCPHFFYNVVLILYDSQTSEAALCFLRIGSSSSLSLLVFLLMVWADMFQLKLLILSLSHHSFSLQCRFCFSRCLFMYLFIMYNWCLCMVLKSNLCHNYPFWVFKFKDYMKAYKLICQRSPMLLDQYMRLCGVMVDSV